MQSIYITEVWPCKLINSYVWLRARALNYKIAESTALSGTNVTCFILWLKFADAVHARPVSKGEQALPWEGRKQLNWIKKNERRFFPTRLIRLSSTSTPTKYSSSGLWKSKGMMCSVKPSWRRVVKLVHRVEARWLARWLASWTFDRELRLEAWRVEGWPLRICCFLRQQTLLIVSPSSPRCVNGCWRHVTSVNPAVD